jgi:hypothetical protein
MSAMHLGKTPWLGRSHKPESIAKQRARFNPDTVLIRSNGYAYVYMPDDDRAVNGRVAEHVVVMEKEIGRRLLPNEVVHHVNRIRCDNEPNNLRLMDKTDHSRLHFFAVLLGWSIDKGYFEVRA